jgi:CO dehydrogenase/acetyl-CoA synthase delta subunit
MASLLVLANLYPVFRGTEMKTNFVRLLENFPVSERRVETGARRSDDGEGQTARRLPIAGMRAMTAFGGPDVHLPFVTDDGETILADYTGPIEQTDKQESCSNESTD